MPMNAPPTRRRREKGGRGVAKTRSGDVFAIDVTISRPQPVARASTKSRRHPAPHENHGDEEHADGDLVRRAATRTASAPNAAAGADARVGTRFSSHPARTRRDIARIAAIASRRGAAAGRCQTCRHRR